VKTYITTDTHFNHMKLAEVYHDRPMDFQDQILKNHNFIEEDSVLIHLGDFCIGGDEEAHQRWNEATSHIRTRILVRGNHDHKSNSWYYDHGWDAVVDSMTLNVYGATILFTHIPARPDEVLGASFNIHGHTHGNTHRDFEVSEYYDPGFHIEIAMEKSKMRPVLLSQKLVQTNQSIIKEVMLGLEPALKKLSDK